MAAERAAAEEAARLGAERSAADAAASSAAEAAAAAEATDSTTEASEDTFPNIYDERERVKRILGLDRKPTSGEMQLLHGCEQGYIDAAECAAIGIG